MDLIRALSGIVRSRTPRRTATGLEASGTCHATTQPEVNVINTASTLVRTQSHGRRLDIRLADPEGWDVVVEFDAGHVAVEHYNDWRRVERRLVRFAVEAYQSLPVGDTRQPAHLSHYTAA